MKYTQVQQGRILIEKDGQLMAPHCPECKTVMDGFTGVEISDDPHDTEPILPEQGSISVCFYCAAILQYQADGQLGLLSLVDLEALPEEHRHLLDSIVNKCKAHISQNN